MTGNTAFKATYSVSCGKLNSATTASLLLSVWQSETGSGFSTPSSLFRPLSSLHKLSTSERRRGRPPGSLSIPRSSKLLKGKQKKKKKRWNVDGSESDSDDCTGDPDWS